MIRLLLVEDNLADQELVRRGLRDADVLSEPVEITAVESVDAALALLERESFTVIIADYSLPKRTGLELLHALQSAGDRTPVIMLTGSADTAVAVRALQDGAVDFVLKDIAFERALAVVVRRALEKQTGRGGQDSDGLGTQQHMQRLERQLDVQARELRRALQESDALRQVGQALARTGELAAALDLVSRTTAQILQSQAAAVLLRHGAEHVLVNGWGPLKLPTGVKRSDLPEQLMQDWSSAATATLREEGAPIGLLWVGRACSMPFAPHEIELLEALADLTALSIAKLRAREQLRRLRESVPASPERSWPDDPPPSTARPAESARVSEDAADAAVAADATVSAGATFAAEPELAPPASTPTAASATPARPGAPASADEPAAVAAAGAPMAADADATTVLVVDDSEKVLMQARLALQSTMTVLTATSGKLALEKYAATRPAVVLVDLAMPDMDGIATLAELQRLGCTTCLALCVRGDAAEQERARKAGYLAVIEKPFRHGELVAQVAAVLNVAGESHFAEIDGCPVLTLPRVSSKATAKLLPLFDRQLRVLAEDGDDRLIVDAAGLGDLAPEHVTMLVRVFSEAASLGIRTVICAPDARVVDRLRQIMELREARYVANRDAAKAAFA